MRLLLDTHLILWALLDSPRLSTRARTFIEDPDNEQYFSAASLWEIAIKTAAERPKFRVDATKLRESLLANRCRELEISSAQAIFSAALPKHHKDPFDRLLVAQAILEGLTLITADPIVAKYPGSILLV